MSKEYDPMEYRDWQSFYERFRKKTTDPISLEEYKNASAMILAEEKSFTAVLGFVSVLLSVLTGSLTVFVKDIAKEDLLVPYTITIVIFSALLFYIFIISCAIYFANKHKEIILSKRKLIILRFVLGLDYYGVKDIFPNNSEVGAINPFRIKYFTSLFSKSCFPIQILILISFLQLFISSLFLLKHLALFDFQNVAIISLTSSYCLSLFVLLIYRKILFEDNETLWLVFIKFASRFLMIKISSKIEYLIFKAVLAAEELSRIGIDSKSMHRILVEVEDKEFFSHNGINIKRTIRAFLGILPFAKPSGGGSSITQQLARTLFIRDYHKTILPKIIELLLALWLNNVWPKGKQLDIYLAAVRFEKNIIGINQAMKFFFGDLIPKPSNAVIFFLIERVSNINSTIIVEKLQSQIRHLFMKGLLNQDDICELRAIYKRLIASNKILTTPERFERLDTGLQSIIT